MAEVDLDACAGNHRRLLKQLGERRLWAVVKADAYGHGAVPVARRLQHEGAFGLGVATVTEARELRDAGIHVPVLVMSALTPGNTEDPFRVAAALGLTIAVPDMATVERLAAAARAGGHGAIACHLKVDTGMGRLGCPADEAVELARAIAADPALTLDGVMSNLATADSTAIDPIGMAHVASQLQCFRDVCAALSSAGLLPEHRTFANSAALLNHPATCLDPMTNGARPGLALYGGCAGFDPVMRLRTAIAAIRQHPAGAVLGYGTATVTCRPSRIAVLPLGYHDGLPRALANRGEVSLRGRRAPIVGAISMDLTLVDVTDIADAAIADEVVVFGERGDDGLRVEQVAARANSIPHEILCRIGPRVPRRWVGEAA